jgi:hypothetical protein
LPGAMFRGVDRETHARYLDYRERHAYFGKTKAILSAAEFEAADREQRVLEGKGESRDDEEEARYAELSALLFRD